VAISQHYLPAHNERDNEELITHVARRPGGALGVVQVQLSARPRSRSMLVEVSGLCGTASKTLRPKRLPIHIGSAGERARPPVQSFFVPDQMNRTEPGTNCGLGWVVGGWVGTIRVHCEARDPCHDPQISYSRTRSLALIDFSPPVCIIATSPVVFNCRILIENEPTGMLPRTCIVTFKERQKKEKSKHILTIACGSGGRHCELREGSRLCLVTMPQTRPDCIVLR
jgi:hypothetical protein